MAQQAIALLPCHDSTAYRSWSDPAFAGGGSARTPERGRVPGPEVATDGRGLARPLAVQ
jgi:hypothetical protein